LARFSIVTSGISVFSIYRLNFYFFAESTTLPNGAI